MDKSGRIFRGGELWAYGNIGRVGTAAAHPLEHPDAAVQASVHVRPVQDRGLFDSVAGTSGLREHWRGAETFPVQPPSCLKPPQWPWSVYVTVSGPGVR